MVYNDNFYKFKERDKIKEHHDSSDNEQASNHNNTATKNFDNSCIINNNNEDWERRENPAACIFVASLNKNVEDAELTKSVLNHFKQWGNLLSVKVLKDWCKRPYAFVQFESVEDSQTALREAPDTIVNGRAIRCEQANVNRSVCLISSNVPFDRMVVQSQLSSFGEIEDITIVLQPVQQGTVKYYSAFVKYRYRGDAIKAYLALKGSTPNKFGDNWYIEWATNLDSSYIDSSTATATIASTATATISRFYNSNNIGTVNSDICRVDKRSIYVGNLPESITENDLRDRFHVYGKIINIHMIRKFHQFRSQQRKAFSFIKFGNEAEAGVAQTEENGQIWRDKRIRVQYREYPHNMISATNPTATNLPPPYYYFIRPQRPQQTSEIVVSATSCTEKNEQKVTTDDGNITSTSNDPSCVMVARHDNNYTTTYDPKNSSYIPVPPESRESTEQCRKSATYNVIQNNKGKDINYNTPQQPFYYKTPYMSVLPVVQQQQQHQPYATSCYIDPYQPGTVYYSYHPHFATHY